MVENILRHLIPSISVFVGISSICFATDEANDFFETKIRPTLVEHCFECHSKNSQDVGGGLLLDSRDGLRRGGDSGKTINEENVKESLLLQAMRYESLKMPPTGKLPDSVIASFEKWLVMGAPDPRMNAAKPVEAPEIDWDLARDFWSFRPRSQPSPPLETHRGVTHSIDAFIAKSRDSQRLLPVEIAEPETWLRRVFMDLTGIPPSAEEIDTFLADSENDRYERTVDRLLASPGYGTRWGRHWLDLARYADSNGADENHRYPVAWRYRDYVIDAFNRDLPFDEFALEQLAGDLLPHHDEEDQTRKITATGFLVIGPKMLAEQDKPKLIADLVDEQIDTVGKVFMGLTLGCARCHDHKFDPILTSDYYALAGIFHSTQSMEHLNFVSQWNERVLPNAVEQRLIQAYDAKLNEFKSSFRTLEHQHQWNAIASDLHKLLGTMHWKLYARRNDTTTNDPIASSIDSVNNPWIKILTRKSNGEDIFYVWSQLTEVSDATERDFEKNAKQLWQAASSGSQPQNELLKRMRNASPPRSSLELVALYQQQLEKAFHDLIQAQRKPDGKFESGEMQRLYNQLVGKTEYFRSFDTFADRLNSDLRTQYLEQKSSVEKMEKERPQPTKVMATQDANAVKLVAVHVRGNHLQTRGVPLERNVPFVFRQGIHDASIEFPEKGSGRLQFARWLINPSNPLTARVIVNRIWQGHFGVGLVPTPSNFGFRGESPTHPELLDWLSNEFVASGWSLKWLHRQIVLSETYRLKSTYDQNNDVIDPNNRWYWRQNKHRLEAEALRDTLLAISNSLDLRIGGAPQNPNDGNPKKNSSDANVMRRKTIFLEINRAALADFFATFDYVEPGVSVDRRSSTIVPHQSLFLMNHPLPIETGKKVAEAAVSRFSNDGMRLAWVVKTILGRSPRTEEAQSVAQSLAHRAGQFQRPISSDLSNLGEMNSDVDSWTRICRSLLLTNEFLYVE